jgi:alkylhydroperoxidase/carboxymuconolactone decarboxylase family protein YurZ
VELGTHVRGAVRNGASEVEIREALLQARYVLTFALRARLPEGGERMGLICLV